MSKGRSTKANADEDRPANDHRKKLDKPRSAGDAKDKLGKKAPDKRSVDKKTKVGKRNKDRVRSDPQPLVPAGSGVTPKGQRLFDMPYSAVAPRLIKPAIGLHNLVTRAGHNAGYTIEVTVLDAPDHRLIRSGVLLAHRVLDGRGEWYLGATDWLPLLPGERIEPMGQADLPESLADLVRPFRRRAPLGPVAGLTCERREFALRDDRGNTLALLRDDKVTVRRGGLTTARYREVMLTPTGPGLTEEQADHVTHTLAAAGATSAPTFPPLVTRLGAPATGPTDFPAPCPLDQDMPFAQFVSQLLATRLLEILRADLAVRTGSLGGAADLVAAAQLLRSELQGLSSVVGVSWLADLDEELGWVVTQAEQELQQSGGPTLNGGLVQRLRSERYLTLLDRLVTATRAPQVGNASSLAASEVLGSLLKAAQATVEQAAGDLRVDSPAAAWSATGDAFDELFRVTGVATHLLPERVEQLRHRLGVATQLLAEAEKHDQAAQHNRELASKSSADEAFSLGRSYEHELAVAALAREAFVRRWTKTAKKLK